MFEIGRICLKTAGREAGKYCVIVKSMNDKFVLITGPKAATKVKRRRCNKEHLEPLVEKINIHSDASDTEILKVFEHEKIYDKLSIEKPDTVAIKAMKEEKAKKKSLVQTRKPRLRGGKSAAAKPQERKHKEPEKPKEKAPEKKAEKKVAKKHKPEKAKKATKPKHKKESKPAKKKAKVKKK